MLAVLCTDDGSGAWRATGQARSRILLRDRAEGVWTGFFSQPVQVGEAWVQLRHALGIRKFPQPVFRLGHAEPTWEPTPATPRRSVDEVTQNTLIPA